MSSKYACCGDVPYESLVKFLQKMSEVPAKSKDKYIRQFLDMCVPRPTPDIFQTFRLLLPLDDMERRSYRMKQEKLAEHLVDAAGLSRQNPEAKRAINWRQAGVRNAGNFPEVVEQYVLRRACLAPDDQARGSITIADVNTLLDRLAAPDADKKAQVAVLREAMGRCTARQMKWLVRIVLKEIKVGLSQAKLMSMFHPDGLYLLQMTSDLQYVTTKLADPATREPRMDIEPGRCVMAQRCVRVNTVEDMFRGMRGGPFTVEMKLDGNRMQLHKTPQGTFYFSRRGREHGELTGYTVFDEVLDTQVSASRVVLDGELIVWNKTRGVFEPFGGLRSTVNAANEGAPADKIVLMTDNGSWTGPTLGSADPEYLHPTAGDLELVYVAFDILFHEHESLITLPLRQRQQRLAAAVACLPADPASGLLLGPEGGVIRGRIVTLLPDVPLPLPVTGAATAVPEGGELAGASSSSCPAPPGLVFSRIGATQQDLQDMMEMANARQEEGIVAKALDSPWKADDKSGSWIKLKPDYFHMQEVDAVIIGGYYGSGRNGGLVAEFLLGLTEGGGVAGTTKWCSFCRVGTGMNDSERAKTREKLQPVLEEAGPGTKVPPCYRVTGREKPDFWVTDPTRSIVVEVTSDIRTIASNIYAADHSLRFPRIKRVRWDRHPCDITSYPELEQMVLDNKGRLASVKAGMNAGVSPEFSLRQWGARRRGAAGAGAAGGRGGQPRVVDALTLPDTKGVEAHSVLLSGASCYFHNYAPPSAPEGSKAAAKQELGAIVVAHGGRLVAAPTPETNYVFAAVLRPDFAEAQRRLEAKRPGSVHDVLDVAWLRELDAAGGEPVDLMPRHYLFMSAASRTDEARREEGDDYGNPWYSELQVDDVEALVDRLIPAAACTSYQQHLAQGRQLQEQQEDEALAAAEPAAAGGGDRPATQGAAAAAAGAAAGRCKLPGALTPPGLQGVLFRTEESVVLGLQKQLQALAGWRDKSAVLFSGCCLLFVPFVVPPEAADAQTAAAAAGGGGGAVPAPQQQQQQQCLVLSSAVAAQQLAHSWQHLLDLQQLAEAKLAVTQHGGTVAAGYSSAVTHVVLWPFGWRRQQLAGGVLFGGTAAAAAGQQRSLLPRLALLDDGEEGGEGLPGDQQHQQQRVEVSAQALLQLLAGAAAAAADAGVTTAASRAGPGAAVAAAATPASSAGTGTAAAVAAPKRAGGNSSSSSKPSVLRPSRGKFKIAAQPTAPAAAAPAAAPTAAAAVGPGLSQAGSKVSLLPGSAAAAVTAVTLGAAGGAGDVVMQSLLADRAAAATGASQQQDQRPPPSPAALKLLRKMRRRLLAAQQDNSSRTTGQQADTAAAAAGGGDGLDGLFVSGSQAADRTAPAGRSSSSSDRHSPLRPLLLVGPGWVVDSIRDLQQQLQHHHSWRLTQLQSFTQQQQQQLTQGQGSFTQQLQGSFTQLPLSQALHSFQSFDSQLGFDLPEFELRQQRRNEGLYLVRVTQQQQQQQQDGDARVLEGNTAAAAMDVSAVLPVQAWPWESVGLQARQGGGDNSSGESTECGASDLQPSSSKKGGVKSRAKRPTAAASRGKKTATAAAPASAAAAAAAAGTDKDTESGDAAPAAAPAKARRAAAAASRGRKTASTAAATAAAAAAAGKPPAPKRKRRATKIRSPSPETEAPATPAAAAAAVPPEGAGATQPAVVADSYDEDVDAAAAAADGFDSSAAVSQAPPSSKTRTRRGQNSTPAAAAAGGRGTKRSRGEAGSAAAVEGTRRSKRARGAAGQAAAEGGTAGKTGSAGLGVGGLSDSEGEGTAADDDAARHGAARGRKRPAAAAAAEDEEGGLGGIGQEEEEEGAHRQQQQQQQPSSKKRLRHTSSVKGPAAAPPAAAADGNGDESEAAAAAVTAAAGVHSQSGGGGVRGRRGGHSNTRALFDDLAEEVPPQPPSEAPAAAAAAVPSQQQHTQHQPQLTGNASRGRAVVAAAAAPGNVGVETSAQQQQQQQPRHSSDSRSNTISQGGGGGSSSLFDALFSAGATAAAGAAGAPAAPVGVKQQRKPAPATGAVLTQQQAAAPKPRAAAAAGGGAGGGGGLFDALFSAGGAAQPPPPAAAAAAGASKQPVTAPAAFGSGGGKSGTGALQLAQGMPAALSRAPHAATAAAAASGAQGADAAGAAQQPISQGGGGGGGGNSGCGGGSSGSSRPKGTGNSLAARLAQLGMVPPPAAAAAKDAGS